MNRIQISATDHGKSIAAHLGDELVLSLPENPTTGYRWQLNPPGKSLVLESDRFELQEKAMTGAAGIRQFSFCVSAAGQARLRLALIREWETDKPPLENFSLLIEVQPG